MTALLFDARHETPSTRAPPSSLKQAPARDYISFSAIRTYQQCPLRYFFRYIAGIPEETISATLVFGSAVHRAIEYHFRELLESNSAATQEDLLRAYQSEWRAQTLPVRFSREEQANSFDTWPNGCSLRSYKVIWPSRPAGFSRLRSHCEASLFQACQICSVKLT
jgi:hypothetical protein